MRATGFGLRILFIYLLFLNETLSCHDRSLLMRLGFSVGDMRMRGYHAGVGAGYWPGF